MPTRPDSDRWLFGVTLALCLFGAVMILSASAVTAEQLYGHSYIFLVRQAAWLLLRSEEHTSELQSLRHLVCRLLLEKKKKIKYTQHTMELEIYLNAIERETND